MNNKCICQSCAMPMDRPELFGTNADGSQNKEYCCYCYKNGAFLSDCTMQEMLLDCIDIEMRECPEKNVADIRAELTAVFPTLKRWKKE